MHYDFKTKLNKIDSQQYRNLRIPEIDWKLNEAQELFVKLIATPRVMNTLGFETSQRSIDDIRTIVVKDYSSPIISNLGVLPENYWHFISGETLMDKGSCTGIKSRIKIKQQDDEFEKSPFDKSSFEWREVNAVFYEEGIKFFDDGSFTNTDYILNYIKKLNYIHNAEDFGVGGTYTLPSGIILTGAVDCELPEPTHREIVDIAVSLASSEMQSPDYQNKIQKLNINNLL